MNVVFFQMELGINAGLPNLSCRDTQEMNVGTRTKLKDSMAMLTGCLIACMLVVRLLRDLSALAEARQLSELSTYAKT